MKYFTLKLLEMKQFIEFSTLPGIISPVSVQIMLIVVLGSILIGSYLTLEKGKEARKC